MALCERKVSPKWFGVGNVLPDLQFSWFSFLTYKGIILLFDNYNTLLLAVSFPFLKYNFEPLSIRF